MQWIVSGLRLASRRYGRMRVNILVGYAVFVVVAIAASALTVGLHVVPQIAAIGLEPTQLQQIRGVVWSTALILLFVLCSFGFTAIWLGMVRPMDAFRSRTATQLADTSTADALAVTETRLQRARQQLQAALVDNSEMRRQLRRLEGVEARYSAITEALVDINTEATVLVGADGRIVDLTSYACEMLGRSRDTAIGRPFAQVVRLFDEREDVPREHALDHLIDQALEAPSALPRIHTAILLDQRNAERRAVVSIASVIDRDGHCAGATVRIALAEGESARPIEATAATLSIEADASGERRLFDSRIGELIRLARMREETHCLLWVRLDQIATISDQHGYLAAEELVRRIVLALREQLGEQSECFQISTDRIAVLLGFRGIQDGLSAAEHVRQIVASRQIAWKGARLSVTGSVAVVGIDAHSDARAHVLAAAEELIGALAAAGGNVVRARETDQKQQALRRQDGEWLDWIKPRLQDGRAHFISQEVVSLSPGERKPSLECYLRVEDDDGVWLTPGAFMLSLERLHQTGLADLWVLRAVLDQMERQPDDVAAYETVFVNFSVESLLDPEFHDRVFHTLVGSSIPASRICFEFEERVAAMHAEPFCRFADIVRPTGAGLAMDRCRWTLNDELARRAGIGYVKFHESVIKRAMSDTYDRAHLEWLGTAAKLLRIRTVACGVEDEATLGELRRIGIDYAQGVIINKMGPLMA